MVHTNSLLSRLVLLVLVWVPITVTAAESYSSNGVFGQIAHQGLTLTVSAVGQADSTAMPEGAVADFVMADGCLFAAGYSSAPIAFDHIAAQQRTIKASGEVIGYGYDACHENRHFQLAVTFTMDLSPLRAEGYAISSLQQSVSHEGLNTVSQRVDADQMTARVNFSAISTTLTFLNTEYSFTNQVNPSQGIVGYLRERRVVLSH